MAHQPRLIIQLPRGSAVERQLGESAPAAVTSGEVVVEAVRADAQGQLESPTVGKVVLSVPSPEALAREAGEVRRVVAGAGAGAEPLVVEVDAAEELRDDELAAVVDAAGHTSRAVILRILRDA
jgi:hypothetical protein